MIAAVFLFTATPALADIAIKTGRLGNVFAPSENMVVSISADTPRVSWSVTDFFGSHVRDGLTKISAGRAGFTLNSLPLGWYELTARAAGAAGETARTTLVVMPRSIAAR
jgi:hypothetical protein